MGQACCKRSNFFAVKDGDATLDKLKANRKMDDDVQLRTTLLDEYLSLLKDAGATLSEDSSAPIRKDDVLIVVDMQNDFLPVSDAPTGGRFGVPEGGSAAPVIAGLIQKFAGVGATVIATRDYHPSGHASFATVGGPFPPHCIQGSEGSKFYTPVADALNAARKVEGSDVHVVFKGLSESIDSFGAFTYSCESATGRVAHCGGVGVEGTVLAPNVTEGLACSIPWTGAFELKCSNSDDDISAPPDVLAVLRRKTLKEVLGAPSRRVFVCGLAWDFCVLDTAVNAVAAGFSSVAVVADACRAAHIPGVGTVGSGFLTEPAYMKEKLDGAGVKLMRSEGLE